MTIKTYEGQLIAASDSRFGIVVGRFNSFISARLLEGALDALKRHGVNNDKLAIAWVPGAFELPLVAKKMAESGKYDAIIALGAIIRGSTPHFDYIASETSKGLATVSLSSMLPISFGVLTCDTIEQAIERAGTKAGNKGFEAAVTVLEMVNLLKAI